MQPVVSISVAMAVVLYLAAGHEVPVAHARLREFGYAPTIQPNAIVLVNK
jgi:hypothetical protein